MLALPDAEDNDDGLDPNAADGASGDDQMPDSVPLPSPRPRALDNRAAMPPAEDRRAPQPQPGDRLIAPPAHPPRAPTTVIAPPAARQQPNSRVAIAKPDNPTPGVGQVFRNLFGAARREQWRGHLRHQCEDRLSCLTGPCSRPIPASARWPTIRVMSPSG